jgi:small subunit ribosomal protein S5
MAEKTYIDTVVDVRRVTKVTKGGKRFSFSAFVVSGDQEGKVGIGLGKSKDVSSAIAKATSRARKDMFTIAMRGNTIPYDVTGRHGASHVLLRSTYPGTGMIVGGPLRAVMKAAGIKDVLAKTFSSGQSDQNLVKATLNALAKGRTASQLAHLRGKTITELTKGSHASAK